MFLCFFTFHIGNLPTSVEGCQDGRCKDLAWGSFASQPVDPGLSGEISSIASHVTSASSYLIAMALKTSSIQPKEEAR